MDDVIVYTCITFGYDNMNNLSNMRFTNDNFRYVIFTDDPRNIIGWDKIELKYICNDRSRTSRWHKINSHLLFPNKTVIWIDGNQAPTGHIDNVNSTLMTMRHPLRDCVYDEAEKCKELSKDNVNIIDRQIEFYKMIGYPRNNGLVETSFILRNNNKCREFNNMWWNIMSNFSFRDQLSFNFVSWYLYFDYEIIKGSRLKSDFLKYCGDHVK